MLGPFFSIKIRKSRSDPSKSYWKLVCSCLLAGCWWLVPSFPPPWCPPFLFLLAPLHAEVNWWRKLEKVRGMLGELGTDLGLKQTFTNSKYFGSWFYRSPISSFKEKRIKKAKDLESRQEIKNWSTTAVLHNQYLGPSISGTCRKLLLLGLGPVGGEGAARAKISATGT